VKVAVGVADWTISTRCCCFAASERGCAERSEFNERWQREAAELERQWFSGPEIETWNREIREYLEENAAMEALRLLSVQVAIWPEPAENRVHEDEAPGRCLSCRDLHSGALPEIEEEQMVEH
jgi:hypothetical protein